MIVFIGNSECEKALRHFPECPAAAGPVAGCPVGFFASLKSDNTILA